MKAPAIITSAIFLAGLLRAPVEGARTITLAELAAYTGSDREQVLAAGAKKEGTVFWYTSLTGGPNQEIPKAFEGRYPGVKVETYRGSSQDLMAKILEEAQARHYLVDTIEGTLPILKAMRDVKLLAGFNSPYLGRYPTGTKKKAEKGLFSWASERETYIGLAYNKQSLGGEAAPRSYEDLLKPELKGKIGFSTTDTGIRVVGAMIKFKGQQYINKLKAQNIRLYAISGKALLDLVISGEVGASPTIFRSQATVAMAKGAPIGWRPMEIVPTNAGGVAVAARSPHPYAAVLLLDFILSSDGQKILEKFGLESPAKDFGFRRWYPEEGLTTEQYEKEAASWDRVLRQIGKR